MKSADWKIVCFEEVNSTNDVALKYSQISCGDSYVIKANRQKCGRGRRGRSWISLEGNLFFSMLLEFDLQKLGELVILSSLSLWQSIKRLNNTVDVMLKWPNDVLLNGAKVSGILLEKAAGNYIVVGIGVNIKQAPFDKENIYPVISLKDAGLDIEADDFLHLYIDVFTDNINLLQDCGFEVLRRQWIDNARGIGSKISLSQSGNVQEGIFRGIDENANLLLEENGVVHKISAGDVFYKD